LDPDNQEFRDCIEALKRIDFELAYLALLTSSGLKPMSRWEKPLSDADLELFQQIGLLAERITRTVKTGKQVVETVFSRLPAYIQLYRRRFADTPIDKSPQTQRFEGFLFGYPPCCIDQYIRHPYAPNDLPEQDQKILFHWPCKNCQLTPTLLPPYRTIHNLLNTD